MSLFRARSQVLAAALLFSTSGAAIKATVFDGWQTACLRSAIAAVLLLLLIPRARDLKDKTLLPAAAAYAAMMTLFVLSTKLTTSANAIFLENTAPLYIFFLAPLLLGEKKGEKDSVYLILAGAGLAAILLGGGAPQVTAPDPFKGNLIAVGAGLAWALTLLGLRGAEKKNRGAAARVVVLGNLLVVFITLPMSWPFPEAAFRDLATVAWLGAGQTALAYVLLTAGVAVVPAFEAAMILLVEPVLNPIWTWAVHGETPSDWALAGGFLIIGSIALRTWASSRKVTPIR